MSLCLELTIQPFIVKFFDTLDMIPWLPNGTKSLICTHDNHAQMPLMGINYKKKS